MRRLLPGGRGVGILTGRTARDERLRIIEGFRSNNIGLIVATSVVEVGMDIPSATLLVVDQAERFGLSQLHQMRGRVARGSEDSFSYFIVSESAGEEARARVDVLESSFDGFEIAEKDLMFRGPGDVIGTRQHGISYLRFARLPQDVDLMLAARDEAFGRILGGDETAEWREWMAAVRDYTDGRVTVV
jgi:ATP-dependent DNA helicase RecG